MIGPNSCESGCTMAENSGIQCGGTAIKGHLTTLARIGGRVVWMCSEKNSSLTDPCCKRTLGTLDNLGFRPARTAGHPDHGLSATPAVRQLDTPLLARTVSCTQI